MLTVRNFIDGAFSDPDQGPPRPIIDPSTGAAITTSPETSRAEVDRAVAAASRAAREWGDHTPAERAGALLQLADIIDANAEELASIEQRNVGKPTDVAAIEPQVAADGLRFFAGAARLMEGTAAGEYNRGVTSMLRRDPIGVVGAIVPWNYPLSTAVAKFAPALAAGCPVVVKPSELTPLSAVRFCELAAEVLPPGVFNMVTGEGHSVGTQIAAHADVAMISMTGSPRAGREIATTAATTLKRLHLELGGNAPVVVFPDADIDAVVETMRFASFWNSGQECGAASRLLVHRDLFGKVRDALADTVQSIVFGPADDSTVEMGPVISAGQRRRLDDLVDSAISEGASTVGRDRSRPADGYYVAPTVVWNVDQSSAIVQQETFGPVVTVQPFDDEEQAVAMANGTPYGLSASIWTADVTRGLRLARTMRFGTTWINSHLTGSMELPWGGPGDSGGGRDASIYALEDHTITRNVSIGLGLVD